MWESIGIEKALTKALYGAEFPWHTAGVDHRY